MAEVFREDFDGLADGTLVTAANTAFDTDGGDGTREADTAFSVTGGVSCAFICATTAENVRLDDSFTATGSRWFRWYFRPPSPLNLANQPLIALVESAGANRAEVRIENDGTLSIRESGVEVATTTTTVTAGDWNRIEWGVVDGGNQTLRLFVAANMHGTTPDDEISDLYAAGTFDTFTIGPFAAADAWTHHVDSVVADNTTFPGPEVVEEPAAPAGPRVELRLANTWTDITGFVYQRDPVTITRGRSDEASQVDPGRCSFTVNNRDGRFSPRNPRGPYFGSIGRNTPLRVFIRRPGRALFSPGQHDRDRVDTPDSPQLSVTGDIDIRVDLTAHNWSHLNLAAKYETDGNQRSWWFATNGDGTLHFRWSEDGTLDTGATVDSTEPIPWFPTPGRHAVRVTLNLTTNEIQFSYGDTIDTPAWTLLGDPVSVPIATGVFDSTAPLEVGDATDLGRFGVAGRIHAFELRDGIDGPVVANPDFSVPAEGASSFTDPAGNLWTVRGEAEITDKRYRFHGEVSEWPQRWDTSDSDVYTQIQAAGILRRLAAGAAPLKSALRRELTSPDAASRPVAYWPCEDGRRAEEIASALDSGRPMTITGTPDLAADNAFVCSEPLPTMGSAIFKGRVPRYEETDQTQVRLLLSIPDSGAGDAEKIVTIDTTGTVQRWDLEYSTIGGGGLILLGYDENNTQVANSNASDFGLDGFPARVSLEFTQNGPDIDFDVAVLKVGSFARLVNDSTVAGHTFGRILRVSVNPGRNLGDVTVGHVSVHNEITDIFTLDSLDGFTGEPPGTRMRRLTGEEGIGLQIVGNPEGAPWLGPQLPVTLVDLFHEAAESDSGMLFEPRDTLAVGLRTHDSLYNQAPVVELGYAAAQVAGEIEPVDDDQQTRNDVTVSRQGGSSSRQILTEGPLSTQPPPDGVGRYNTDVTVSAHHGEFLPHTAGWRVRLGTVDEARYPRITTDFNTPGISADPDLVDALLFLDVGDRLTVVNPPEWLPPEAISQIVQGYTETFDESPQHTMTLNCSPETPHRVAEVDETGNTASRYGTSDSALAAGSGSFPVVADHAVDSGTGTSHEITIPPRNAGDVIVLYYASTEASTSSPSDLGGVSWTQLASGGFSDSGRVWWLRAANSDGSTVTVTPSASDNFASVAVRVTGAHASTAVEAASTNGTDPPALDPSGWGVENTLWLAAYCNAAEDVTAYPDGYTLIVDHNPNDVVAVARRDAAVASEDPGAFTAGIGDGLATTVAIRPAAAAGADSDDTSLSVATVSGPLWTTDAAELPLDVMVGGERMTVTDITGTSSPQNFLVTRSQNGIVKNHLAGTAVQLFQPAYRAL